MSKVTKLVQEIASGEGPCVAFCDQPPWYFHTHPCPNRSTLTIAGLRVCGTHARVLRKWIDTRGRKDALALAADKWAQR